MADETRTPQELLDENQALRTRVEELEHALREHHNEISLGRLTPGVAHDFNNLLQTIQSTVSLALADIDAAVDQQIRRGAKVAEKLLHFSRQDDTSRDLGLNLAVAEVAELFGRARRQITLNVALAKEDLTINSDPSLVNHVLLDLFLAAENHLGRAKSMFVRTLVVPPHTESGQETAVLLLGSAAASVSDAVASAASTSEEKGALGHELEQAAQAVEGIGGRLGLISSADSHYTLFVRIPLAEVGPGGEPSGKHLAVSADRILVVDDEELVLEMCAGMVERAGYVVATATSGEDALEKFAAEEGGFDLVILDVIMPGISGLEVCRQILDNDTDVNVILTSGFIRDEEASRELVSERCRFIQKPYSMGQLLYEVKTALGAGE